VKLSVNGTAREVSVDGGTTLLHVLRDALHLTGTKRGCDYGVCGACTVLIDGRTARSCLALAATCEGREITTVEGIEHPVQRALIEKGAIQCGFCTSGVVMTCKALLDDNPRPTREEVIAALNGNLCRCTGYAAMVEAVLSVARG